jgi:hypothetical protein
LAFNFGYLLWLLLEMLTVIATVPVTADVPWRLLEMLTRKCAMEECKKLLQGGAGGMVPSPRLTSLLHKALEHAAAILRETAVNEIHVSCVCDCVCHHDLQSSSHPVMPASNQCCEPSIAIT